MGVRIASWNVNSVRARIEAIRRFVRKYEPDVLCLQEIKVENHLFPRDAFLRMGFVEVVVEGQKGYHGVAIASRRPLRGVSRRRLARTADARHVAVELDEGLEVHDVYVPAGGDDPNPERSPAFAAKLPYLRAMSRWMRTWSPGPRVLVGDLNVAPLERDVWSHEKLKRVVTHTEIEVTHLRRVQRSGRWVDVARVFVPPDEKLFTWWSHRGRWQVVNKGRRLDHIWVSPCLESRLRNFTVAKEVRGWRRPSDHVPIFVDLDVSPSSRS